MQKKSRQDGGQSAAAGSGKQLATCYRIGAVARMVGIPVSTLRVWNRRHGVGASHSSPAGHRLYTGDDIQRVALLKRLTDVGHAIGVIAKLDDDQLQAVASTHAGTIRSVRQARTAPLDDAPYRVPGFDPLPAVPGSARRYDNSALKDFASLSRTIECECPKHVAELLSKLSQFEDYSAQCAHLSERDAELHRYLQAVAASARLLFESAIERIIEHEGILTAQDVHRS